MVTPMFGKLGPRESAWALMVIVFIAFFVCLSIAWVASKYGKLFFKNPNNLKIKVLGAEIDFKAAGVTFIFLAVLIVLTILYVILRMAHGSP